MRNPHRFYHTHQATGPAWHDEPPSTDYGNHRYGRVITRQGSPKMYYLVMAALISGWAYILAKVVFDII